VTLTVSRADLRGIHEYPYRAAIASGVMLVMVSWAVYPALDPRWPAGLSSAIIGGELRQRLGFTGVTITDALEAAALRTFGTTAQRATLAAGAGMDLILCASQSVNQGDQARIALQDGLGSHILNRAAFTAAVNRNLSLRSSLHS
jgi:beta-N-acetylhexosaminidase